MHHIESCEASQLTMSDQYSNSSPRYQDYEQLEEEIVVEQLLNFVPNHPGSSNSTAAIPKVSISKFYYFPTIIGDQSSSLSASNILMFQLFICSRVIEKHSILCQGTLICTVLGI